MAPRLPVLRNIAWIAERECHVDLTLAGESACRRSWLQVGGQADEAGGGGLDNMCLPSSKMLLKALVSAPEGNFEL